MPNASGCGCSRTTSGNRPPFPCTTARSARFPIDVWVDAQGRIRRIQVPVPLRSGPPVTRSDGEPRVVTIDYDTFGAAPTVTVPSANQIGA